MHWHRPPVPGIRQLSDARSSRGTPPYPFLWGITNLIFIGLALGAVLDPTPQEIWPKLTGTAALLGVGAIQLRQTTKRHNTKQRGFTAACVVADLVLIVLLWTVR